MTLHEYRGKVVLLIFWGHWCPPCRAMYPQIKAIENNWADDPFVVLGVNSDRNRDDVKKTLADQKITWRSFGDGGSTSGPIAKAWNVNAWPTIFLIDHRGVIRNKWQGFTKVQDAIEVLVKEARGKE